MFDVDLCIYIKHFESFVYKHYSHVNVIAAAVVTLSLLLLLFISFFVSHLYVSICSYLLSFSSRRFHVGTSQELSSIFCFGLNNINKRQRHQRQHKHDEWNIRAAFVFVPLRLLYTFCEKVFWSGNGMQSGNKHTQCVYIMLL